MQVIPHIADEDQKRCVRLGASNADIVMVEIGGGTVGDIESSSERSASSAIELGTRACAVHA